ncbi:hypothetical protein PsorP6_001055 [Peronosclerospora sorghi]|uniref:Uncharacterized protein n=1 Tax=Peronosclerospora sorghi TaxID=230839 RepID=A0ACC0WQL6_9STRA|nr:hypothetical protein PsorP6_001055 [Peronosclerospora sorghi]
MSAWSNDVKKLSQLKSIDRNQRVLALAVLQPIHLRVYAVEGLVGRNMDAIYVKITLQYERRAYNLIYGAFGSN